MSTETQITAGLVKALEGVGAVVVPYTASKRQPAGYPDRIVWHGIWAGWLELKGHQTAVQLNQRIRMEALNARRPGSAWVLRFSACSTPGRWWSMIETPRGKSVSNGYCEPLPLLEGLNWYTEREILKSGGSGGNCP